MDLLSDDLEAFSFLVVVDGKDAAEVAADCSKPGPRHRLVEVTGCGNFALGMALFYHAQYFVNNRKSWHG